MKKKMYNIRFVQFAVIMVFFTLNPNLYGQTSSASCNFYSSGSGTPLQVTVGLFDNAGNPLTQIKSGLEFNLAITTPGGIPNSVPGCNISYSISIKTSDNLVLGNIPPGYPYPFSSSGGYVINSGVIPTNVGCGINVPFKFKPGITCNGETGSFKVTVTLECDNGHNVYTCTLDVDLKAVAQNYWTVKKEWIWGNLSGGAVLWRIRIKNTNPNRGIGDLNISHLMLRDHVSHGKIISITNVSIPNPVSTKEWYPNPIPSTTYIVDYYVYTYMCDPPGELVPPGTVVENCVKYKFALGKGKGYLYQRACDKISGKECDKVKLVSGPTAVTNFSKTLTYANNLNYAQGCEGEYRIFVNNNGNIPLTNLEITDYFPTGIDVTKISISGSGVNMGYTTNLASGTYNTSSLEAWNFTTSPTSFLFNTTSGSLLGGSIEIRIRFTVTAGVGTNISNCATLTYLGTYDGVGNWCGISLPPIHGSKTSCAPFQVQPSVSIPGLRKCISTGQQSFMIGQSIPFRIVVSNHGQGDLSGTLSDILGTPTLQKLELVPGSVTYYWGDAPFSPYSTTPACIPGNSLLNSSTSPPSWINDNLQPQNLTWNINNMPGICELDRAFYLVVEFDAKVLPQAYGSNYNTTKLVMGSSQLSNIAYYNIMRVGKINVTKQASSTYVEPGQQFNYIVTVQNLGSVAFNSIIVEDQLPTCVTPNITWSAIHFKNDGSSQAISGITHSGNIFEFPAAFTLQPGERTELVIVVTANITDPECCNQKADGRAKLIDTSEPISDISGPACVQSSLCCDMEFVNVMLYSKVNRLGNLDLTFVVSAGVKPIMEVDISLIDYHIEYNPAACKPLNIGNLTSHIQAHPSYYSLGGVLNLTGPATPVNNALSWVAAADTSLMFNNQVIRIYFVRPSILNIDCCEGTVYYCFKVRLKDTDCNVCEKIVCGSASLSNPWKNVEWLSPAAEDQYKIKSLEKIIEDDNLLQMNSIPVLQGGRFRAKKKK